MRDASRVLGSTAGTGHTTSGTSFLKTLPNLWPDPSTEPVTGLLFHRSPAGHVPRPGKGGGTSAPTLPAWQRALLRLAGYRDTKIRIVRSRPAEVVALKVPERPVALKAWARPEAAALWERIGQAAETLSPRSRVYLSRSHFHRVHNYDPAAARSTPAWDDHLEAAFTAAGFTVVHPETLPLEEQLAIVRGADVIAGQAGSALHLTAFAHSGSTVIEIGDTRSPAAPLAAQATINAVRMHRSAFVGSQDRERLQAILWMLRTVG